MTEVAPIRREVAVQATPERAFAVFTAHIGRWWPLDGLSVFGGDAVVAFEGDRLVERLGEETSVWGEVTAWDPPRSFSLDWHPGGDAGAATTVTVSFVPQDPGTLVSLVHSGWERTEAPAQTAAEYGHGWPEVLERFAGSLSPGEPGEPGDGRGDGEWYALVHTPGPALEEGTSLFAHPAFQEHLAFLGRLHDRGLLVAAGPVFPERGEGMTVVRVLPHHGDLDVAHLAAADDQSVVAGVVAVEVRPWGVGLTGV